MIEHVVQWASNNPSVASLLLTISLALIAFLKWFGARVGQWVKKKLAEHRRRKAAEDWIEFLEGYDGNL